MIDSFPAKYLEGAKWKRCRISAVFGDSSFSVMVTGVVKNGDTSEVRKIRESIFHLDHQKIYCRSLAEADFTLDDSHSEFKFSNHNAMLYLYTIGGEKQREQPKPIFMVMELPRVDGMDINAVVNKISMSMEDKGFYKKVSILKTHPISKIIRHGGMCNTKSARRTGNVLFFWSFRGMYKYYCLGYCKTDFENELKSF